MKTTLHYKKSPAFKFICLPFLFLLQVIIPSSYLLSNTCTISFPVIEPNDENNADLEVYYEFDASQITQSEGHPLIGKRSYNLIVKNNGPDEATNIIIQTNYHDEVIPYDRTLTTGSWNGFQWIIPTLTAGESVQMIEYSNIYFPFNNKWVQASLMEMDQDDPDSTPGNWIFTEDDADKLEILHPQSDLDLTLAVNELEYDIYEYINYEVAVQNFGPSIATNVTVSIPFPPGTVLSSSTNATQGTYSSYNEIWDIGSLDIGQTVLLNLVLFTLDTDGPKSLFAQVQTADQPDPDSTPGNDTNQSPDEDDEAKVTIFPEGFEHGDLIISAAPVFNAGPGSTIMTFYDIRNIGPGTVPAGFTVAAYLSEDEQFTTDDVRIGERIIPSEFPAGLIIPEIEMEVSIPVDQEAGSFYVIFFVDANDEVAEVNEANNFYSRPVLISNCVEDILLKSQAEVDAFNCPNVIGNLTITGDNITNLDALASLTYVTRTVIIVDNPNLVDINGLSSLTATGAGLWITRNDHLPNLNGLEAITSVGGHLSIRLNPALEQIDALSMLASAGGVRIENNDILGDLDGLSSLTNTNNICFIYDNDALQNVDGLASLTSVGEWLTIRENLVLQNIDGLAQLDFIGEDLSIFGNSMLNDCCGIYPILGSNGVSGTVHIYNNPAPCNTPQEVIDDCTAPDFCSATSAFPWHEWISKVQFNTIDNSSHKTNYSDFTSINTTLEKDGTYPLTIETSFSYYTADEYVRVWIDYNQNGSFSDPGEMVFDRILNKPSNGSPPVSITDNIKIPFNIPIGNTRMRVSMQRGSAPMPCGTIPFGEVEDYTIDIIDTQQPFLTLECPGDIYVTVPPQTSGSIVNWDSPTFSSTCLSGSGSFIQTGGQANGSFFPVGVYVIEYVAADNCGNQKACFFTLFIETVSETCSSESAFPWHDWISQVSFAEINKASGKSTYSDFTATSAQVLAGNSYPISLETSYSYYTYDEYWKVWIDYNGNNVFEEPEELAFSGILEQTPNGTASKTIGGLVSIPNDVSNGIRQMRVSMKRSSYPSPCELLPFGEVEDYTVNIGGMENEISANEHTLFLENYLENESSIENQFPLDQYELFPNPAKNEVFVNLNKASGHRAILQIHDTFGRTLIEKQIQNIPDSPISLELTGLENGLYFLSIKIDEMKIITKRFVIEDIK